MKVRYWNCGLAFRPRFFRPFSHYCLSRLLMITARLIYIEISVVLYCIWLMLLTNYNYNEVVLQWTRTSMKNTWNINNTRSHDAILMSQETQTVTSEKVMIHLLLYLSGWWLVIKQVMTIIITTKLNYFLLCCWFADVRELVELDDVMEAADLQLGPNGGLVFCME